MNKIKSLPRQSIATQLIKKVLGYYLILVSLITFVNIQMEYINQKKEIYQEFKSLENTFNNSIAVDLWQLDEESLMKTISGMLQLQTIQGLWIEDADAIPVAVGGIIQSGGFTGKLKPFVDVLGLSRVKTRIDKDEYYDLKVYSHTFPLIYSYNLTQIPVGEVTLYSNASVILKRMKLQILFLLFNSVLTLAALTALILWHVVRIIRIPLENLAEGTKNVSMDNLGSFKLELNVRKNDELSSIEDSFNTMISNLNKSEQELKWSQNYIVNIIDSMPSIVVAVDQNGLISQWNKEAELQTEKKHDEVLGKNLSQVFPRFNEHLHMVYKAVESGENQILNNHSYQKDGETYYDNILIFPIPMNGGVGAVIRIDDTTRETQLEMQLAHSRKMDAIGQLAGGVAHDFNNMLGGITGAAQLLLLNPEDLSQNSIDYVNMILESSQRAAELTNKLLLFSYKGKTVSTAVDIHKMIEDCITIFGRTFDKRIRIESKLTASDLMVAGDPSSLQSVIMNLGINSSHAMPEGGVLTISTQNIYLNEEYCQTSQFNLKPGNFIKIDIRDTGSGIPAKYLDSVFDPFFTTKKQGEGTGLGLSAVYGAIKTHNGAVLLHSAENVGTVFHLFLPCSELESAVYQPEQVDWNGKGHILFVDDEQILRTTVRHTLESLGFTVSLARNGVEAVKFFRTHHEKIDMVIMDMIMPEMNGNEAYIKMREIDPACRVLISSGFADEKDLSDLRKRGVSGFLKKPFQISELSNMLFKILSKV